MRSQLASGLPYYGWRGADGRVLRRFLADFPEATRRTLGQNFRSSGRIVALANGLAGPVGGASLWTANAEGPAVALHVAADAPAEAAFVAAEIARLVADEGVAAEEVAVLYRVGGQATPLALALRGQGLPYRVAGGGDPFASREARDLVAYLRLAYRPDDAAALARIVNTPPRQLGALARSLRQQPRPPADLPALAAPLGRPAQAGAAALLGLLDELHRLAATALPAELLDRALARTGYAAWLDRQADRAARLANVATLRAFAAHASAAGRPAGSDDWLAGTATAERDRRGVTLSTIHAAKGAEWRVVFLVGWEEGLLPHARALAEADGEAAERRVAYVAVTRARERLYLTRCRARERAGRPVLVAPSRFLRALPPHLVRTAA